MTLQTYDLLQEFQLIPELKGIMNKLPSQFDDLMSFQSLLWIEISMWIKLFMVIFVAFCVFIISLWFLPSEFFQEEKHVLYSKQLNLRC